ncbi:hypothetical protein ACE106_17560 [Shouchella clausii]|uniref:hypothetical protein n=1 Tax=Shouchella clausii TaxID=79880 RepID=UPI00289AE674|nr:hypothetical protein [Shouchella clausii]
MEMVVLLNRPWLDQELEDQGILDVADELIERMKEQVRYTSKRVYEQVVVDAKVLVGDIVKTVVARFTVYDYEDAAEDGEAHQIKYVEFDSLSQLKEV